MNQALKIGGIVAGALVLVAGGIVAGLALSGGLAPNANTSATTYAYGPGAMMGYYNDGVAPNQGFGGMMGGRFGRNDGRGYGPGMMGGYGRNQGGAYGPGMMGGYGNSKGDAYGYGPGMMGGYGIGPGGMMGAFVPDTELVPAQGETLTLEQAAEVAEAYVASFGDDDLELAEVMQFSNHFYGEAVETSTGIGAFEFLIDPATAAVFPEFGPNMMWNVKYGHMGGGMMGRGYGMMGGIASGYSGEMTVTPEEAVELAQAYLDEVLPGTAAEEAEPFYGYYTLHTIGEEGEITGMLSVNGYTGQVWPHTWHGEFVAITGEEHQ